ncbi:MAG TPA: hypothetical protein VK633_12225 [Verrucomicrobiae bacterium]|nr:hypothetical protein [Verrucomicrobiae bacterium]
MTVEVTGLAAPILRSLRDRLPTLDWARAFPIVVEQSNILSALVLPPISGHYTVTQTSISFRPEFPFEPGLRYRATFQPGMLDLGSAGRTLVTVSSLLELPAPALLPATRVTHIYPSADSLPENLLKFYLHFSAPMSGGHIYDHIHLLNERGKQVELPFLEIDEELWNLPMTRLTLFLDPGRIKRGLKPLEEVGPSLIVGAAYTLLIDTNWLDAAGVPLKTGFEKRFKVTAPDREAPDLENWSIDLPPAGSHQPLRIDLLEPMDHALTLRMITVALSDASLKKGHSELAEAERLWIFIPDAPWQSGTHHLIVQRTIEDLAGNNIGRTFEVDLFEGVQKRLNNETVSRAFEIK